MKNLSWQFTDWLLEKVDEGCLTLEAAQVVVDTLTDYKVSI